MRHQAFAKILIDSSEKCRQRAHRPMPKNDRRGSLSYRKLANVSYSSSEILRVE